MFGSIQLEPIFFTSDVVKHKNNSKTQILRVTFYTHTHTHTYIYIYIYEFRIATLRKYTEVE